MKFIELYPLSTAGSYNIGPDQLDEAIWDTLKTGLSGITSSFRAITASSGSKNSLNDETLRKIYSEELELLKNTVDGLPTDAQDAVWKLLAKRNIKPTGVDLSRKNLNRIAVVKLMRLVVFTMRQMRDNGIEWILSSVVSGGLLAIISLLLNAKNYVELTSELRNTSRQLTSLYNKSKVKGISKL